MRHYELNSLARNGVSMTLCAPMNAGQWHEQLLGSWAGLILQLANAPDDKEASPLYGVIRRSLQNVIDEKPIIAPPGGPIVLQLPRLGFVVQISGRITPHVESPPIPQLPPHDQTHWDVAGHVTALESIEKQLLAVVAAIAADPRSRRLRRCDWKDCGIFFFAGADHRRDHHFCSEGHRRNFDRTNRDPRVMARYMKKYRATKRERAQKQKARKR